MDCPRSAAHRGQVIDGVGARVEAEDRRSAWRSAPRWLCLGLGAVFGGTIVVGSLLPRGLQLLPWYMPGLTHVLAYGSVAFLLAIAAGRDWQWAVLISLTGLGVGVEVAQHLVPRREAHLTDALLNLGGICVGLVMAEIVRWAYRAAIGRWLGRPAAGRGR